jgi:hypothetical protein
VWCPARGTGDRDRAAQRLDAVGEPDQPGSADGVGAADAVVADRQVQGAVAPLHVDLGGRRLGVLGDVGQRFGHDVVRADLDRFGQPLRGAQVGDRGEQSREGGSDD